MPQRTSTPSGLTRRAFTLIELLVVISIIALLVALLLPTLQAARVSARGVLCMTNLHQQGLAIETYRSDEKGFYPMAQQNMNSNGTNVASGAVSFDDRGYNWMATVDRYVGVFYKLPSGYNIMTNRLDLGIWQCPEAAKPTNFYPQDIGWTVAGPAVYGDFGLPQYAYNQGFGFYNRGSWSGSTVKAGWLGLLRDLVSAPSNSVTVIDAWVAKSGTTGIGTYSRAATGASGVPITPGEIFTFKPSAVPASRDPNIYGGEEMASGGYRHVRRGANRAFADGHVTVFDKETYLGAPYTKTYGDFGFKVDVYPYNLSTGDGNIWWNKLGDGYPGGAGPVP